MDTYKAPLTVPKRFRDLFGTASYISRGVYGIVWKVVLKEDEFKIENEFDKNPKNSSTMEDESDHLKHDKETQIQTYAVKTQRCDKHTGVSGYVLRELNILSRIEHPNILKLFRVYHGSNSIDILLELYDVNLETWIENNTWDIREGLMEDVFRSLLDALCTIHKLGIYHMDIKADNILLNVKTKKICLCDFGIASVENFDSFCNIELCTIFCRPPELLAGLEIEKSTDTLNRIDVWSLGCVFFQYIVKLNPFNFGTDEEKTLMSILCQDSTVSQKDYRFLQVSDKKFNTFKADKSFNNQGYWNILNYRAKNVYFLIKSMLTIQYKNRPTSKNIWGICDSSFPNGREKFIYKLRLPYQISSNYSISKNVYNVFVSMCSNPYGKPKCFKHAIKLYIRFIEQKKSLDLYNTIENHLPYYAACCTYISFKFKYYCYPALVDILPDGMDLRTVIACERNVLSTLYYRIEDC